MTFSTFLSSLIGYLSKLRSWAGHADLSKKLGSASHFETLKIKLNCYYKFPNDQSLFQLKVNWPLNREAISDLIRLMAQLPYLNFFWLAIIPHFSAEVARFRTRLDTIKMPNGKSKYWNVSLLRFSYFLLLDDKLVALSKLYKAFHLKTVNT